MLLCIAMFKNISSFINNIPGIIIGLVVGIIVSVIICAILKINSNRIATTVVTLLISISFAFLGFYLYPMLKKSIDNAMPEYNEVVEVLRTDVRDGWSNTNGGFIIEQIKLAQDDDDCPTLDDQIVDMYVQDFGDFVCFSYVVGRDDVWLDTNSRISVPVFQNISFLKLSDNRLFFDGSFMSMGHFEHNGFLNWGYDYSLFYWDHETDVIPYSKQIKYWSALWSSDSFNQISISSHSAKFIDKYISIKNKDAMLKNAFIEGQKFVDKQLLRYFVKWSPVEIVGSSDTGLCSVNTLYTYLWNNTNQIKFNTSKLVDVSSNALVCAPIPKDLQSNYPITSDIYDIENSSPDYYGVYNCNIGFNITMYEVNKRIEINKYQEEIIKIIDEDPEYEPDLPDNDVDEGDEIVSIILSFNNKNGCDLTNIDLENNPVEILFTSPDVESKHIVIDSLVKLNNISKLILSSGKTYSYEIVSNSLLFDNYFGSFTPLKNSKLKFDYDYLSGYVLASVGLNPIGTIDLSTINLAENPVKIILSNTDHSYQFVFDDNSKIDSYQSMLVEMGTYTYTILSKEIVFASVTGTLTITTTDRIMLFNYAQKVKDSLLFSIDMPSYGSTPNYFYLYSESSNVDLIRNTLSSAKVYTVTCVIYDKDGKVMETFNHTHSVTGICSSSWYASNLKVGEKYTLQLRFADRDDNTKTYLSDICDFTYNGVNGYEVHYAVTENK